MIRRWIALSSALLAGLPTGVWAGNATVGDCADFESGQPPGFISRETTSAPPANGRVVVTMAFPRFGVWAIDLDTDCNGCGGSTLQAAIVTADLAGESHPQLRFWVHEHGDENNPEDGVFISDDSGVTYFPIVSLNNFPSTYVNVSVDLEDAATGAGMNLVNGFLIKFQSMDNFSIPTDGYSFDDICLLAPEVFMDGFESGDLSAWTVFADY